jgi:CO/xanthine dehydrogenase FAD-binding subunit
MIVEYHRPAQLEEALKLLARQDILTIPIGGGSALDRSIDKAIEVVDLQSIGLDGLQIQGNMLELGASLKLQELLDAIEDKNVLQLPALSKSIYHEATYNLRQVATIAGTLVAASGRSPFATVMLALNSVLTLEPGDEQVRLEDFKPLSFEGMRQRLITKVAIPSKVQLAYEYVARSPADLPIVSCGVAAWPSGRIRVTLGGFGAYPLLAFDGSEATGIEDAARSAFSQARDQWASAEYRQDVAGILAHRAVQSLLNSRV